jgi:hypothetical protein
MGPWTGGVVGSRWTKGGADIRHNGASPMRCAPGAAGLQSSPMEAGEGEGDEPVPMRGSSGHGRRQRGGAVVGSFSSRGH